MTNKILNKVLEKISLSKAEETELKKIAKSVIIKIPNAKVGGSLAKSTLVKKQVQDIDIFVAFNNQKETKKLGQILTKKNFEFKTLHGSRDYFQIKKSENTIIEIIPVVKLKKPEQVENITDFSLSHVNYIKNKLNKNKQLANQIKLAKVFSYACECYGAESYIGGFSGYALELLIIHFKTFTNFLKKIQKKQFIDIEKSFKSESHAKQEINTSKLQSPILLIDPTYKYRNACAGLSKETFEKFIETAKKFLKNPSEKFFIKEQPNREELEKQAKKQKAKFIEIKLKTNRQEGDIAGTKMKKFFNFIIKELERKQQKVVVQEFVYHGEGQSAEAYLGVKEKPEIEIKGPPISNKTAVAGFKKSRGKIYKKQGHYWTKEKVSIEKIFKKSMMIAGEIGIISFDWKF